MVKLDVLVLGGGPAGKASAIKCSQLGLNAGLIEQNAPGDVAIKESYFPVKVLIEKLKQDGNELEKTLNDLNERTSYAKTMWQQKLVQKGVKIYNGEAVIEDDMIVSVNGEKIQFDQLIIATGSLPGSPSANVKIDEKDIISHITAVKPEILKSLKGQDLTVLGGDVEGCEFATLFNLLGARVTVVEKLDRIMPKCDEEVSEYLAGSFTQAGIQVRTNISEPENFNKLLVTGKRLPALPRGINKLGLTYNDDGFIMVDEKGKTNLPHIFAAGDIIGGIHSANAAILEGETAAANISGYWEIKDYSCIPYSFFCSPEITGVGQTEQELKKQGTPYTKGLVPFSENLRAQTLGFKRGFVKILVGQGKNENCLLGAHIIGDGVSELIHLPAAVYKGQMPVQELTKIYFPHPTMGEMVREAVHQALNQKFS